MGLRPGWEDPLRWCRWRTKRPSGSRVDLDFARIRLFRGQMATPPHQTIDDTRFAGRLGLLPHQVGRVRPAMIAATAALATLTASAPLGTVRGTLMNRFFYFRHPV
jgi:hypothetical protein